MQKYYLNNKSIDYVCETLNLDVQKVKDLNKQSNNNFIYLPNKSSGVTVLNNYPKDVLVVVDKEDNIKELKDKYKIKGELSVGDAFIVNSTEKYIVKPLDTFDKIVKMLGVSKEYLISKNNLKTDKVFVGQILII